MSEPIKLVVLGENDFAAEHFAPAAEKILHGAPNQSARNDYEAADGRLSVGEWRCAPGAWRVNYGADEHEFCTLLEGHVRLTDEAGNARDFRAGDAFVIPAGFRGVWETLVACRKHYVIVKI